MLNRVAKKHGMRFDEKVQQFVVQAPSLAKAKKAALSKSMAAKAAKAAQADGSSYLMMYCRPEEGTQVKIAKTKSKGGRQVQTVVDTIRGRRAILLAHEQDGEITDVKTLLPR